MKIRTLSIIIPALLAIVCGTNALAGTQFRIRVPGLQPQPTQSASTPNVVGDGTSHSGACAIGGASNCAVFSASNGSGITVSSGGQTATSTGTFSYITSSTCKKSGKWYFEFTRTSDSNPAGYVIYGEKSLSSTYTGSSNIPYQASDNSGTGYYDSTGDVRNSAGSNIGNLGVIPVGGTLGIAMDADAGTVTYLYGSKSSTVSGVVTSNGICPSVGYMHAGSVTLNAGQSSFVLPVPTGYYMGIW